MSAGQEIGSPIRENRTLLPAPLPPDEARGTLAAGAGGASSRREGLLLRASHRTGHAGHASGSLD